MANRVLEIYLVKPKATTNLITNPSFEFTVNSWAATGAGVSISRATDTARRGLASCEVHTASGVASGVRYAASLTIGKKYTFSVDVYDLEGPTFNVFIGNNAGTALSSVSTWTGTGHWHRRSVTYTPPSSTTYYLYVTRSAYASTENFFIDGALLEEGNESTYFDGDSLGYNPRRKDYWWNGTAHGSTSYRSIKTRTGGEIVRLRDFASLLGVIGLGAAPVINYALPSNASGAFYQSTKTTDREITLAVQFNGDDYGEIMTNRAAIVDAVDPNAVPDNEPMRMRVVTTDSSGVWQSEMLDIPVHYAGGLEGATDPDFSQTMDKVALRFNLYLPYLTADGETAVNLTTGQSLTNPWGVLYKDHDGQWSASARTSSASDYVYTILPARDGSVYVGGNFANLGGVANADYLAKWNGTAYVALSGAWVLNDQLRSIVEGPDGSIYVGGYFTNAGGVAAADSVFKWDGTNVTALGTGIPTGPLDVLKFDKAGNLYAGGAFPSAGGVADTVGIAKWNGTAWSALGTGITGGTVRAIAFDKTYLYAGGTFTSAGGVANTDKIARWNGSEWQSMGNAGNDVYALFVASDGYLYAGGAFSAIGGVAANGLARWNGTKWEAIPCPPNTGVNALGNISTITEIGGSIYIGGSLSFSSSGLPQVTRLVGNSWFPLDISIAGTTPIMQITSDSAGRVYLAIGANATATSSVVTVTNASGARSYPRFTITGPGTLSYIKNETTGKGVYFSGLTVQAGETLTLDFRNNKFSFTSNWRGNMADYLQQSSDYDMFLQNGANNIAVYMTGTTAASSAILYYTPGYTSIDKTER